MHNSFFPSGSRASNHPRPTRVLGDNNHMPTSMYEFPIFPNIDYSIDNYKILIYNYLK